MTNVDFAEKTVEIPAEIYLVHLNVNVTADDLTIAATTGLGTLLDSCRRDLLVQLA